MRIAIVDNELIFTNNLKSNIERIMEKYRHNYSIDCFNSGNEVIAAVNQENYDLIFLDIDMPEQSGLSVANDLNKKNNGKNVIFVTNCDHLVYEALKVSPLGFVRKGHLLDELIPAINNFMKRYEFIQKTIMFKLDGTQRMISAKEIMYIESQNHTLYIHCDDGIKYTLTYQPMKELYEELIPYGFIKTHKSFIINPQHINVIKDNWVVLNDETNIPISRSNVVKVKQALLKCTRGDIA